MNGLAPSVVVHYHSLGQGKFILSHLESRLSRHYVVKLIWPLTSIVLLPHITLRDLMSAACLISKEVVMQIRLQQNS